MEDQTHSQSIPVPVLPPPLQILSPGGVEATWDDDELRLLQESMNKHPSDGNPQNELNRLMLIAKDIRTKPLRDVALRVRLLERSPRTQAIDENHPSPREPSPHSPRSPVSSGRRKRAGSEANVVFRREQQVQNVLLQQSTAIGSPSKLSYSFGPCQPVMTQSPARPRRRRMSQPPPPITIPQERNSTQQQQQQQLSQQSQQNFNPHSTSGNGYGPMLSPVQPCQIIATPPSPAEQQTLTLLHENWWLLRMIRENIISGRLSENVEHLGKFRTSYEIIIQNTDKMVDITMRLPFFPFKPTDESPAAIASRLAAAQQQISETTTSNSEVILQQQQQQPMIMEQNSVSPSSMMYERVQNSITPPAPTYAQVFQQMSEARQFGQSLPSYQLQFSNNNNFNNDNHNNISNNTNQLQQTLNQQLQAQQTPTQSPQPQLSPQPRERFIDTSLI